MFHHKDGWGCPEISLQLVSHMLKAASSCGHVLGNILTCNSSASWYEKDICRIVNMVYRQHFGRQHSVTYSSLSWLKSKETVSSWMNSLLTWCWMVSLLSECRSLDCEHCFSRDFCTKCKAGFQLHKGRCLSRCPEGTFAHQTDCLGE